MPIEFALYFIFHQLSLGNYRSYLLNCHQMKENSWLNFISCMIDWTFVHSFESLEHLDRDPNVYLHFFPASEVNIHRSIITEYAHSLSDAQLTITVLGELLSTQTSTVPRQHQMSEWKAKWLTSKITELCHTKTAMLKLLFYHSCVVQDVLVDSLACISNGSTLV